MNELIIIQRNNLLIILFIFFSLIASINNEIFNFSKKSEFDVELTSISKKKYLEYLIFGNDTSINYVLSAYDNSNRIERVQLGQSYFGKTKLYLSIEDYKDKIYFDLECSSNYNCSGEKNYSFLESIELIQGEPINYYVNKEDEIIYFSIHLKNKISNVWARGQYNITTELSSNFIKKRNIENSGEIYIIKNENEKDLTLKVTAKKGDYINVGYIEYDKDNNSISELENEGPPITGYLHENVMNNVCYKIKANDINLLGKGIIFTKYAKTYLKKDNKNISPKFTKEFISHKFKEKISHVCFTFPNKSEYNNTIEEIVFTYEIENPVKEFFINKEPQLNGIFYPGAITNGSRVVYISHKNGLFDILSFKLNSFLGFPKMNIAYCNNYPLCLGDVEKENFTIRNINRFSCYNMDKNKTFDNSPISKNQTLFIVECKKSEIINEENYSDDLQYLCEYNTIIYTNKDVIQLQENNYFKQYVRLNHEHEYKIKLTNEINVSKVNIIILVYIGEVEINTEKIENLNLKPKQYDEINKLHISIQIDKRPYNDLYFSIKGLNNTFYTIFVSFSKNEEEAEDFIINKLKSGIPYLVTLKNEKAIEKVIGFQNERVLDNLSYMVNFFSLNCKIKVTTIYKGENKVIDQFDRFSQEIIESNEEKYKDATYQYKINVEEQDLSLISNNLCKVFASSTEISEKLDNFTRDILLPDNVPQQVMFGEEARHITLGYTHVAFNNDLLIKFNLIHTAKYIVRLYFENQLSKEFNETIIVSNNIMYLKAEEWINNKICLNNKKVCYIRIDIILAEFKVNVKPILEISIKSMGSNIVSYIPKNYFKLDYVQNIKSQYYYTEIGKNEKGFIIINFLRGSGRMYSKIIEKNRELPEKGANWRGKYVLPFEEDKEMLMDPFTKKIKIKNTDKCRDGCYLLLNVFPDVQAEESLEFVNYPYSIFINLIPSSNYDIIPPIKIPIDQYIVGAVTPSQNFISEFYSVWLTYDAKLVNIDFQTNNAIMYINVKDKNPSIKEAKFKFYPDGKDTIYSIQKEEILQEYSEEERATGLRDKVLTIGIWTNMTDSMTSTPFSFAVRLGNYINEEDFEIYRVNSDQKALCKSNKFKSTGKRQYRCLYVIDYENIASYSIFYAYASSQNKNSSIQIFANIINSTDYEIAHNINIPDDQNHQYCTEHPEKDFLYIDILLNINQYILVSVEIDTQTTIEFITTISILINEITPNPLSYQLFYVFDEMAFNFPENYMELVNIRCVGGSGEIYWDNNKNKKYYLKGRDDRLIITSSRSNKEHKLKMKSTGTWDFDFVVIVKYNIRNNEANFDSLNLDKSVNFVYTESDFPVALYCPLNTLNKEKGDYYDIVFTFLEYDTSEESYSKSYETHPFLLYGFIVKESTINDAKLNPGTSPKINNETIEGIYDNAIRAGLIRINGEKLKISDEKLFLYLKIDKKDEFRDKIFSMISFESTVFYKNSEVPVSEVSNQFGYLDEEQNEVYYILRNDKSKQKMNLEFSCEDNNTFIEIEDRLGDLEIDSYQKYGKSYYYLSTELSEEYINLIIRRNRDKGNKQKLYFFFRYLFSDENNSRKYEINNTKIKVIQTRRNRKDINANYTIQLTPVSDYTLYDLTYIVRLMNDKKMPSNSNIVITPGDHKVKEFYNPSPKEDSNLILEFNNTDSKISYIQVVVQIKEKEEVDLLSYDLENNFTVIFIEEEEETPNKNKDDDKDELIVIIIGAFLVVVAAVLVFLIFKFKKKNKDLLEKVNMVSFSEDRRDGENEDLLLTKN